MTQTKLGSLIEACVNIVIGFAINFCANMIVLPWFGFNVNAGQAFGIGLVFTVIAIGRMYVIRRYFNAQLHRLSQRAADSITATRS